MQFKSIRLPAIILLVVSSLTIAFIFQNCSPTQNGFNVDDQTQEAYSAQPGLPPAPLPSPSLPPATVPPVTPAPSPVPPVPPSASISCDPNTFVSPLDKAGFSGGQKVNWSDVFGSNWPLPAYGRVDWYLVPKMGYKAIKFKVGPNPGNISGSLSTIEDTGSANNRFGSISTCPGDWNVPDACRRVWGVGGSIKWSIEAKTGFCQLKKDTVYYFNISTVNTFLSTSNTFMTETCKWTHASINQDYCTMFLQTNSQ